MKHAVYRDIYAQFYKSLGVAGSITIEPPATYKFIKFIKDFTYCRYVQ